MISIFLFTFLACHPDGACLEIELPLQASSVQQCLRNGMKVLPQWAAEHDWLEIKGPFTCSSGRSA